MTKLIVAGLIWLVLGVIVVALYNLAKAIHRRRG